MSECGCMAGFTKDTQGTNISNASIICIPCPPGTFKPIDGASSCIQCESGKFSSSMGSVNCTSCSGNTTSVEGSVTCACNSGFTGEHCTPCASGTFKSVIGSGLCENCSSPYSVSPAASTNRTACFLVCPYGYTQWNGLCLACHPGKFKNITGPSNCTSCSAGPTLRLYCYSNAIVRSNFFTDV